MCRNRHQLGYLVATPLIDGLLKTASIEPRGKADVHSKILLFPIPLSSIYDYSKPHSNRNNHKQITLQVLHLIYKYRVAGNFREVQNFAFFEGRAVSLNWDKLPRTGILHAKFLVGVVSKKRDY